VLSAAQVQVVVNNVPQNPASAFTVGSQTITFTSAPSAGTNNIYVYYVSPITQAIAPSQGTVYPASLSTGGPYWDTSGNVGIGTATPNYRLDVRSSLAVLDGSANIGFYANGTTYTQVWQTFQSPNDLLIKTTAAKYIAFLPNNAEAMRIDSSGNAIVNATAQIAQGKFGVAFVGASNQAAAFNETSGAGSWTTVLFQRLGTTIGSISNATSSTAYNTSSDYRLKNSIAPMTGALAKVAQLKPVTYKWNIDDKDGEGFIAHELAEVCPNAVTGEKDAVDADGNPVYQGIDTSFLVATLTAAIQEQQALITALTARIEALENK
jgi:hypothetical protein